MMEPSRGKRAKSMDAGDRISGLPDELRRHVLSFLPARDAVRTSVLSPRWRHLWASARRLNVDTKGFTSQSRFIKFVNALLLTRGCSPLDSFSLDGNGPDIILEKFRDTAYLWICHALRSNVQTLSITERDWNDAFGEEEELPDVFPLDHCPFTSLYLKRLHLCAVRVDKCFLKNLFSGCPALEDLDMRDCLILATEFSSTKLKKLRIDFCPIPDHEYDYEEDFVINIPSLVSVHIGTLHGGGRPSLVDAHSLVTASIYLSSETTTFADGCKILCALSNVVNLEFLFPNAMLHAGDFTLPSDMQLCQVVFTNLITLSLSDWCLYDNCKALLYLLEHSPNIEKLNLKITQFCYRNDDVRFISVAAVESKAFKCEKLKKVEIVCPEGDNRVGKLVTILLTKILAPPEISIKPFQTYSLIESDSEDNSW